MHILDLKLTRDQLRNLMKGKNAQLKPSQFHGNIRIIVDTDMWKKYNRSLKNGKGFRLHIAEHLLNENNNIAQGAGLNDILMKVKRGVKSGAQSAAQFGRTHVAPVARDVARQVGHEAMLLARDVGREALNQTKGMIRDTLVPRAANYARNEVRNAAYYTEKQIEDKLTKAGLPRALVEEVVTRGQTLTPIALNQIDRIESKLRNQGLQNGQDFTIHAMEDQQTGQVVGAGFSFKKIGKVFKKIGKVLKPLARPLLKAGLNAGASYLLGPQAGPLLGAPINQVVDNAGKEVGFGMKRGCGVKRRKLVRGGALRPAGY